MKKKAQKKTTTTKTKATKASPTNTKKSKPTLDEILKNIEAESETKHKKVVTSEPSKSAISSFLPLVILVVLAALYYFRGQFIVATVNGQPIFRTTLVKELEKQAGKSTVTNLVMRSLINQEAAKQKVQITDKEVSEEIQKIEDGLKQQNQDMNQLLKLQGMTKADLSEQIKLQKLVEKMVGKDVSVSDEEVADYIDKNKSLFSKDTKPEDIQADVKQQLLQQKTSEKIQEWLKTLQTNAKINNWLFKEE